MKPSSKVVTCECDVVVVGAGSSGSAAAWMLAQTGLSVVLIDERDPAAAGARWTNDIPLWMFERAGIDYHSTPETKAHAGPFTIVGRNSAARITVDENPLGGVDMRALVASLQASAQAGGVQIRGQTRAVGLKFDGERPVLLQAEAVSRQKRRNRINLRARLFVDASGMQGAVRKLIPTLMQACPDVDSSDTYAAAKELCVVKDRARAQRFLDRYGLRPGETLTFAGVAEGNSLLGIFVHPDLQHVELGCKTIAYDSCRAGSDWLVQVKKQEPWIGKRIFGGQGRIPVRRPYSHIVAPGVALIGDAACQVYSVNGSGAGLGLCAARLLADAVVATSDPGALEALTFYQSSIDKEFGLQLRLADIVRQALQTLLGDEVELLIGSGLIQSTIVRSLLMQTLPKPSDIDFSALAKSIANMPGLAMRLLPYLAKAAVVVGMFEARQNKQSLSKSISRLLSEKS
jgi:flavin-dependent dehydrogenase